MLVPSSAPTTPAPRLVLELAADPTDPATLPLVVAAEVSPDGIGRPGGAPLGLHRPAMPLLGEQHTGRLTRPFLRGHRLGAAFGGAGGSWTTRFVVVETVPTDDGVRITGRDDEAGLAVLVVWESLPGGALRGRAEVTNTGEGAYLLEGLEVCLPAPDDHVELLDLTGRHERERSPQRQGVTDGLWLREGRGGRPGLDAASLVALGTSGFAGTTGRVLTAQVAWSGNSVLRVERSAATGTTLGGGEHLMPGEVVLAPGESYASPWVVFAAADDGLDGAAAALHAWQRTLPAHPDLQPVVLNVWEAVFFDHDLERLRGIADRAARVGVERFVLDDGWFRHRRDDHAGLGDWFVDDDVWPEGLGPLVEHVRGLGMEFGLWFEPEMVNPDSDLFRAHPEWILAPGPHRAPREHRQQQVLDLTRPEVAAMLLERIDAVLSAHAISYVKWDHNRELLEAGTGTRAGAPAHRAQTVAFLELLAELRRRHPGVAFESCASGGGRIDLGVVEQVQRFWTSDMTDALARQSIQRWSVQVVAPEYLGAHVSSPRSHTTGRTLDLDLRCATALFGAFGIEWDLTTATEDDLVRLADWIERFKALRPLLHGGRTVRPTSSDDTVLLHGVVAHDASRALMAHVALDESAHNRGTWVRVPHLDPAALYDLAWEGPVDLGHTSMSAALPAHGPTDGVLVDGAALARRGFWIPRRRPETTVLVHLTRQ